MPDDNDEPFYQLTGGDRLHAWEVPSDRALAAKIAANTRWSKEDPTENADRARRGLDAKWLREVDPNNELPEVERQRRAECAKRAHFQRMALASAKARRKAAG